MFVSKTLLFTASLAVLIQLAPSINLTEKSDVESEHETRVNLKLFEQFIKEHNRNYANDNDKKMRFKVFQDNLRRIEILNRVDQGTAFYGLNKWADFTEKEFQTMATGLKPGLRKPHSSLYQEPKWDQDAPLPESWDWRDHGAVTPVRDQGMCGSCWAFSAVENTEGVNYVSRGYLVPLSVEQLVECDTLDHGCDGGYMTNAYQSIEQMGGLETDKDYPYKGLFFKTCHLNDTAERVEIDSYTTLPTNETQIAQYVVQNGPISIGINAFVMQFYMRGISHPPHWLCSAKKIDHGVLIVGYGVATSRRSKQIPYWIVKNSWGSSWGRNGYYYVYRGDGTCGLNTMASSVIIKQ